MAACRESIASLRDSIRPFSSDSLENIDVQGGRLLVILDSILNCGKLPIEDLAKLAAREGRRPRPVYGTHKWFARRFGSAFRALLVGAVTPKDASFWEAYHGKVHMKGLTVLDPFVGGGTSVIEAQRLGASWYAADIDPVAVAITDFQSSLSGLPEIAQQLDFLKTTVGKKIREFHTTDQDGSTKDILHHFWVQTLDCEQCGAGIAAHPHYQLAHDVESRCQCSN